MRAIDQMLTATQAMKNSRREVANWKSARRLHEFGNARFAASATWRFRGRESTGILDLPELEQSLAG